MAGGIDWYRAHHGTVEDPKLGLIAKCAGQRRGDVIAMWHYLMEKASGADDRGNPGVLHFRSLDFLLELDAGGSSRIYAEFIAEGLVDGNTGRLVAWDRRQPKRERPEDNSTERSRKHRNATQRQATPDDDDATPGDAKKGAGTPRGEKSRGEKKGSDPDGSGGEAADVISTCSLLDAEGRDLTDDEEKLLWNAALAMLMPSYAESTGPPKQREAKARTFIGGLGKRIKDGGAARRVLFDVIQAACVERPANPETWLSAAVASRTGKRTANKQADLEDENLAAAAAFAGA